jgi:Icc-related predicted phosphoesterase
VIRVAAVGDIHLGVDSKGQVRGSYAALVDHADLLLLAGDLTRLGTLDEAHVVADELGELGIPTFAVLGNHDYQSDCEDQIVDILMAAGIVVLEGTSATIEVGSCRVGVAGIKGFGSGFVGVCATEFGEPEMKKFVRRAERDAGLLAASLAALSADVVIALTHYAPTDSTLDGEPLQIHPFLGSYQLGAAIDASRAVLAIHGHAHRGVEMGATLGGVHVRNVAQPVIKSAYRVYGIDHSGEFDGTGPAALAGAHQA